MFRMLVLTLIGWACLSSSQPVKTTRAPASQPAAKVVIDNFTFSPASMIVLRGTIVTWVNQDDIPHTVTSDSRSFASDALDTDESFTFQFKTPGTYPYHCALHPHMTANIIVK